MVSDSREKSIVIVGFMGAGKTTIGRLLARQLGLPFVDTDEEIERTFGLSVSEIFERRGEAEFRAAERELIAKLLRGEPQVLSLGGGAYLDHATREALNEQSTTVWLDVPLEVIAERVARSTARPLAIGKSALELRRLWEGRRSSYAEAHLRIETSSRDPSEVVARIVGQLD